jgi:hypothetical protein
MEVEDPGLPSLDGTETGADLTWRNNGQDRPAMPYRGVATTALMPRVFDGRWSTDLAIGRLFNWQMSRALPGSVARVGQGDAEHQQHHNGGNARGWDDGRKPAPHGRHTRRP